MPNLPPSGYVATWVVGETPARYFIWRGPGSREMNFASTVDLADLVPNDRFYVHNRAMPPSLDVASWTLTVHGSAVPRPMTFSYDELTDPKQFAPVTIRRVLDCGANGRSFFTRFPALPQQWPLPVGFTEWTYGTMGAAEWTGVRLRDVLDAAGARGAHELKLTGLDAITVQPDAGPPRKAPYEHVIPIAKALADDTLLVYEMNRETLPVDHGYPLRAFLSGWGGNTAVKWLGAIEVSSTAIAPPLTQVNQVLTGPGYPAPVTPTVQNPKSAFELAWGATLLAGSVTLTGRAWSANATIERVEVSIERLEPGGGWAVLGSGWQPATLLGGQEPKMWVRFAIPWEAAPGAYRLSARASDDAGATQPAPEDVVWNQHGLHYNGWVRHPVTVLPLTNMP